LLDDDVFDLLFDRFFRHKKFVRFVLVARGLSPVPQSGRQSGHSMASK